MLSYYLRLGAKSLKHSPMLSVLMMLAIALGVATTGTNLAIHQAMSHNPMAHKDDRLYSLQLQTPPADWKGFLADGLPIQLTYQDANNLLRQGGPLRQAAMLRTGLTIQNPDPDLLPFSQMARATGRDFFAMFEPVFVHGGPWSSSADDNAEAMAVIDTALNERLFGGGDNVGKSFEADGVLFTVTGIIAPFRPQPLFYDLNNGAFHDGEQLFIPFSLIPELELPTWGNSQGWWPETINSYADWLASEIQWLQFWVELEGPDQYNAYLTQLQGYIAQQQAMGRYPNPDAIAGLKPVSEWLEYNNVVSDSNRLLLVLSLLFLLVCLANTTGLLLAKFLRQAPHSGVRRALGASRGQLLLQHLCEVAILGLGGGLLGSLLSLVGLALVRRLYAGYDQLAQMNLPVLAVLLALSLIATLLAGLWPAWRVGRISPARYLKSQ
ncbi:ABC transporter permease [Ferrimonas marina]|uniref:Putative ABC transport system permease protein n=1 Tax=Ferrimonas marina TaxID=299255 RepID=A0A1M5YUE9_9GAMM|nr:ABC transporter permease [Ferrimonas marina]SHI15213.1 putative ABC transport system permease protein [Ferrimonas marina]